VVRTLLPLACAAALRELTHLGTVSVVCTALLPILFLRRCPSDSRHTHPSEGLLAWSALPFSHLPAPLPSDHPPKGRDC
jgi:hypothetical protein